MGSQDGDLRQVDGVGGGSSTTSKVIVVAKSERPNIDVEYTFVQVAVGKPSIDMTGNCGNMSAGVAGFALDERLVQAEPGATEVSNLRSRLEFVGVCTIESRLIKWQACGPDL